MASDSEPRKFFSRPPRVPLRSHISGSKKPVRLLMSNMTQLDDQQQQRQLQNYIEHNTVLSSFLTSPVEKVFFRSVLMMKPHRACTHDRQSFVSPRLS